MIRNKIMLTTLIILIVIIAIVFVQNTDYIAVIGNQKILPAEYKLYFYEMQLNFEDVGGVDIWDTDFEGKTALEVAKERTLNSIAQIKITANKASSFGIKLTTQDKQDAKAEANDLLSYLSEDVRNYIGISVELLSRIMQEKTLRNKVYDEVTKNYQVSTADFQNYYNNYTEETPADELQPKDIIQQKYITLMKDQIFETEYAKWSNQISIQINNDIWDEIATYK